MSAALPACGACGAGLPEPLWNAPGFAPCPSCAVPQRVDVFPAFFRPPEPARAAENVLEAGEAACFYHAEKRAAAACGRCGVFVCALCDLAVGGEHLCPRCLETGVAKRKLPNLENHRFLYDQLVFSLSLAPLIMFYVTIVTAPATIFLAVRYWNAPRSLVRPGRARLVAAVVFASLEILGWVALGVGLAFAFSRKGTR